MKLSGGYQIMSNGGELLSGPLEYTFETWHYYHQLVRLI